ncbi:SigE family RNA polymerase sigma factor [Arsenicicoccus dermatophilus]|uniref:SigE family RNA polymerase sigma factor n=1 Tax=Arsenicicoccus dermatophilus TaxID=1076331 RepID=UPI0039175C37
MITDLATHEAADAGATGRATGPPDFADFFAEQSDGLVRLAYLLLGDAEAARDCAQDALTGVYGRWRRFDGYGQALAYTRASVVNRSRDQLRRRQTERRHAPTLQTDALRAVGGDPSGQVAERSSLWPLLLRLPDRQREVLVLRYWLDLPEREIAETLGVHPGTVKASASRGLATLNRLVQQGESR